MFESRQKQRKTDHVLKVKKQERVQKIADLKRKNEMRLQKEKQSFEKSEKKLVEKGDERMKRQLKFYEKIFDKKDEAPAHPADLKRFNRTQNYNATEESNRPEESTNDKLEASNQHPPNQKDGRPRLSREEFLKMKKEKERKFNEKAKFKSLYGRKTTKGQPVMKYRINHLLSKIKLSTKN